VKNQPLVLITGASQGIGAAIATTFAAGIPGVRLALVARSERNLQATARACLKLGATVEIFPCDVTSEKAVAKTARIVTSHFGAVDVLINNAGAFAMAPFAKTSLAMFDDMIATNLRSAFLVTSAFLPAMLKRKRGDIFFMSSIAGLGAYPQAAAYCAAKFGVTGLARVLRAETKDAGVRVCCVHPGATWSPSWARSGVKPARIMPAEDIARAILDVHRLGPRTVVEEIVLRPQRGDV
jgi:NAD(P)-dependent dehydrogenase (short-subunit alcohol dehydrogenase family)